MTDYYTGRIAHGQSLIKEARGLLDLWQPGMSGPELHKAALESGRFPNMTASRLKNLIKDGFAPRFLTPDETPAALMKTAIGVLSAREFDQLLFLYSCRAYPILHDFVRLVYWPAYVAGRETIANVEAQIFVKEGVDRGRTRELWKEEWIAHVTGYLTGACADFGLLERGQRSVRRILPYRIEPRVAAILAYDLHFAGQGDTSIINNPDWALFGLDPDDVLNELKRMALKGLLIVQSAGGVIDIGWHYKSMEELLDAFTQSEL